MSGRKEYLPIVLVFAVFALLPLILSDYYMHLGILILLWAYFATAWNILGGYAGQHSLGNGLYAGVGAYTAGYLLESAGISPWLSMFAAVVFAGLLGWFIGWTVFRYGLRGAYFALVSIALTEAAVYIFSNWNLVGASNGLQVPRSGAGLLNMDFASKTGFFYLILALTFLAVLFAQWLSRRRFGYQLIAVRENQDAAEAIGVNTLRAKINANILSAVLAAIGGVFYMMYFGYIAPRSLFGETPSVQMLLYAIIGGLGTVWGPLVGAIVLVPVGEFTRAAFGQNFPNVIVYGGILILTMLFLPNGIVGLAKGVRARLSGQAPAGSATTLPSQATEADSLPAQVREGGEL